MPTQPSRTLTLSPVLLDGSLAYLVRGDPAELALFIEALPGALDHDLHRSVRGKATSCHVWRGFTYLGDDEVREHVEAAAEAARCDVVILREPVTVSIPCDCGKHCASREVCWRCLERPPVTTIDRLAVCDACLDAAKEALAGADTMPPPAPDDFGRLDSAVFELMPGPVEREGAAE